MGLVTSCACLSSRPAFGVSLIYCFVGYVVMSSETESEPFQDSGSDYVPSDLGQPSTSKSSDKRPIMTKKSVFAEVWLARQPKKKEVKNE